ncbi:hypothetical protein HAX54_050153 [Datura stramonium]|uniref:NET2A-D/KIP1-like alpha-helical domain-containing protein n=1 Tax=Datura stramonium TaxID=4076 RepID=A0ABS8SWR2_DATST|nr:hypothetical protein [Datura stramonium]
MPKDFIQIPPSGSSNIPKGPIKDLKGLMSTTSKQIQGKKLTDDADKDVSKSGFQNEAVEEIDKLQKDILALQTVKEFIRTSYKNGLERMLSLHLMAEAALQSCQETLTQLQEKQDVYTREAKGNSRKLKILVRNYCFRSKYLGEQTDEPKADRVNVPNQEKIDVLVNKVISLETTVTSQTLLIERLRREADELQTQVQSLEDDKAALTDDTHNLNIRLKDPVEQKEHPSTDEGLRNLTNNGWRRCEKVSAQSETSVSETQIEEVAEKDDELNWQQMLLSGLEDKENILLNDYKTILKNYKEVTKKLSDMEKKDRDTGSTSHFQIRELKYAITKRDEEIHNLRRKLSLLQQAGNVYEDKELKEVKCQASDPSFDRSLKPDESSQRKDKDTPIIEQDEEHIKTILVDQRASVSPIEGKLRISINAVQAKTWILAKIQLSFPSDSKIPDHIPRLAARNIKTQRQGDEKNTLK